MQIIPVFASVSSFYSRDDMVSPYLKKQDVCEKATSPEMYHFLLLQTQTTY